MSFAETLATCGVRYERYRIFEACHAVLSHPKVTVARVDMDSLTATHSPELRSTQTYGGIESRGFAASFEGTLAAVCWYWYGERYRKRGFIPLPPNGAKLVQVTTAPDFRGKGIAAVLIAQSALLMREEGFVDLFARVWHSNIASCRAFKKAGWRERGIVTVVKIPGLTPIRFEG